MSWLVRAEEQLAKFFLANVENELTSRELEVINYVLDHAADILHEPGFVLTPEQRLGITIGFRFKISIITGIPGVGKTKVIVLVNAITAMLYADEEIPTWVVALAGRAASVAREAGTCWSPGCLAGFGSNGTFQLGARKTIGVFHRILGDIERAGNLFYFRLKDMLGLLATNWLQGSIGQDDLTASIASQSKNGMNSFQETMSDHMALVAELFEMRPQAKSKTNTTSLNWRSSWC